LNPERKKYGLKNIRMRVDGALITALGNYVLKNGMVNFLHIINI